MRHASIRTQASSRSRSQRTERRSSRRRPLKHSMKAFSMGLPGRMHGRWMCCRYAHASHARLVNVGPVSHAMALGRPRSRTAASGHLPRDVEQSREALRPTTRRARRSLTWRLARTQVTARPVAPRSPPASRDPVSATTRGPGRGDQVLQAAGLVLELLEPPGLLQLQPAVPRPPPLCVSLKMPRRRQPSGHFPPPASPTMASIRFSMARRSPSGFSRLPAGQDR